METKDPEQLFDEYYNLCLKHNKNFRWSYGGLKQHPDRIPVDLIVKLIKEIKDNHETSNHTNVLNKQIKRIRKKSQKRKLKDKNYGKKEMHLSAADVGKRPKSKPGKTTIRKRKAVAQKKR
jgi:hypothetical protein